MISPGHWVTAISGTIAPTNATPAQVSLVLSSCPTPEVWHRDLCGRRLGSAVVAITPDTKAWTWVLRRPCPECGFDTQAFQREQIPAMLRANAAAWQPVLAAGTARARPTPTTWSPLEYGCHVRDVFGIYDRRLQLMLAEDDPLYPNWAQDETAVRERDGEQDPVVVATQLREA